MAGAGFETGATERALNEFYNLRASFRGPEDPGKSGRRIGPNPDRIREIFQNGQCRSPDKILEFGAGQVPIRTKKNDGKFFLYIY